MTFIGLFMDEMFEYKGIKINKIELKNNDISILDNAVASKAEE